MSWLGVTIYRLRPSGYLQSGQGTFDHRDRWIAAHGPIPPGHHIHHKNRRKWDNRIENLECLSAEQHRREHEFELLQLAAINRERTPKPVLEHACRVCGVIFRRAGVRSLYCSKHCSSVFHNGILGTQRATLRAAARVGRTCPICSKSFDATRQDQRHCSRRCTHTAAMRRHNLKLGHKPYPSKYRG